MLSASHMSGIVEERNSCLQEIRSSWIMVSRILGIIMRTSPLCTRSSLGRYLNQEQFVENFKLIINESKSKHIRIGMLQKHNIIVDDDNFRVIIIIRRNGGIIMNELLGGRIKALRTTVDFTQEQIADKIGISRQKYARIENGSNNITLDILTKIAGVLEVSVADITRVLDETPAVAYRTKEKGSSEKIFDMLDLFYANKHMYEKLQHDLEG